MKGRVVRDFKRLDAALMEELRDLPASIASDCLQRYGAMRAEISPVFEGSRICGQAVTVQSMSGSNLMSHLALELARPGDVLVVDGRGVTSTAVWGGVQTLCAKKRGISGLVVDGAVRDAQDVRRLRFPVFCLGITPAGPHKGWADSVNVPVQCGGVPVNPGDLIIGDDDGVTVVPFELAESVLSEGKERLARERRWIERIEAGEGSLDAVGLREILDAMELEYLDE